MTGLEAKNHILYIDNYFTSYPLFQNLMKKKIYACGTIRSNRKYLPNLLPDNDFKREDFVYIESNHNIAVYK